MSARAAAWPALPARNARSTLRRRAPTPMSLRLAGPRLPAVQRASAPSTRRRARASCRPMRSWTVCRSRFSETLSLSDC